MKKTIKQIAIAIFLSTALGSVHASNENSVVAAGSESGTSAAVRVLESGNINHVGMIAFVVDASAEGKSFERAYFGKGGQRVFEATKGMYIQIVAPGDIPGGAEVGSVVALSKNGADVIATLRGRPNLAELQTFSESVKGMLSRSESGTIVSPAERDVPMP